MNWNTRITPIQITLGMFCVTSILRIVACCGNLGLFTRGNLGLFMTKFTRTVFINVLNYDGGLHYLLGLCSTLGVYLKKGILIPRWFVFTNHLVDRQSSFIISTLLHRAETPCFPFNTENCDTIIYKATTVELCVSYLL